jgi:hypothetical protein
LRRLEIDIDAGVAEIALIDRDIGADSRRARHRADHDLSILRTHRRRRNQQQRRDHEKPMHRLIPVLHGSFCPAAARCRRHALL